VVITYSLHLSSYDYDYDYDYVLYSIIYRIIIKWKQMNVRNIEWIKYILLMNDHVKMNEYVDNVIMNMIWSVEIEIDWNKCLIILWLRLLNQQIRLNWWFRYLNRRLMN